MFNKQVFIILLLAFNTTIAFSQLPDLKDFEKLSIKEYFDTKIEKGNGIVRTDKKMVTLMFLQDFSDTVMVYKGDSLLMNKYLFHDSTLVSTDYTGETMTRRYTSDKTIMTIIYKGQKKYLQFKMNRNFPLYAIYALTGNGLYAVSARKNKMIIE